LAGVFLVLFGAALWIILRTKTKKLKNPALLITVISIWLLSTMHLVLDILRETQAFVELKDGSAQAYYSNLSNPLQPAKTAVYVTLTLIGDSFVIFRCFIVWGRKWYITFAPILLLVGTAVGGYGATAAFSQTPPGAQVFLPNLAPWITCFLSLTFSTNVLCTSLLAYRILRIQQRVRGISQSQWATDLVVIIVESAALYSFSVLSLLIAYVMSSNAQYTVLDFVNFQGIAFTAIILRVSLGLSSHETVISSPGSGILNRSHITERHPMSNRALAVNVYHFVEMRKDDARDSEFGTHSKDNGQMPARGAAAAGINFL
ncbi:hypothetical protein B0H17DRAFT_933106, partial [Mycena rosella]